MGEWIVTDTTHTGADDALIRLILGITIILLAYAPVMRAVGTINQGTNEYLYQLPEHLTASKEFDGDPNTLNYIHDPSLSPTSYSR